MSDAETLKTAAAVSTPEPAADPDEGFHPNGRRWRRIHLDNPIIRGEQKITKVLVTKPKGGDYRGTNIQAVYAMDVVALATVLPRVTEPVINKNDVFDMDAEDVASLGGEVVGFLLNRKAKVEVGLTE